MQSVGACDSSHADQDQWPVEIVNTPPRRAARASASHVDGGACLVWLAFPGLEKYFTVTEQKGGVAGTPA